MMPSLRPRTIAGTVSRNRGPRPSVYPSTPSFTTATAVVVITVLTMLGGGAFTVLSAADTTAPLTPATYSAPTAKPMDLPTLSQALLLALHHNDGVRSALLEREEAHIGLDTVSAGLFGWRVDANVTDVLTKDAMMGLQLQTDEAINALSATLSVRKAVGVSPQARMTVDENRLTLERADRDVHRQQSEAIIETYAAYRQLQLGRLQLELARRGLELTEDAWEVTKDRVNSGTATAVELEEARLQLVQAQNQHRAANQMLNVAQRNVMRLIGVIDVPSVESPPTLWVPSHSPEQLMAMIERAGEPFRPAVAYPWFQTEDQMVREALRKRSEIDDVASMVRMAEMAADKVRADSRPKFEARANYTTTDQWTASLSVDNDWVLGGTVTKTHLSHDAPDIPDIAWDDVLDELENEFPNVTFPDADDLDRLWQSFQTEPEPSWDVRVSVTFNLWDSHVTKLAEQRAQTAAERARIGVQQAQSGIEVEVRSLHANVNRAYDALLLAVDEAMLAQAKYAVEREKQTLGLGTDIMTRGALLNQWQAVVNVVAHRYEYEEALLQLARAKGTEAEDLLDLAQYLQGW